MNTKELEHLRAAKLKVALARIARAVLATEVKP